MPMSPFYRQLSITAATLCASFSAGASMGYPTVLLYQLKKTDSEFPIDLDTASWIGAICSLTGMLGAISPLVMQWRGRKFTYLAGSLILITGWVLVYAASSVAMILISESLHGFGGSILMTLSYDVLSEMITPAYRNIAGQSYCIINALGIATAGAMARFVYWRVVSVIACVPAIVGLLISFTWLESPLWLAYKGDLHNCKINFIKLRGTDQDSMKELQEVMAVHKERKLRNEVTNNDSFVKRIWRQVTSRDFLIPALYVLLLTTHIYWSGTSVIMMYSIELISKATNNETAGYIGSIVINFVFVTSAALSNIFVKFYKNKTTLLIGTSGAAVCLLSACVVTYLQSVDTLSKESLLLLYCLVGYIMASSAGQIPVEMAMSAELVPVKHRGLGGAVFILSTCLLYSSTLKASPYLFEYLGLWGTFLIYTLNSTICGLLIWKYVPETKGKTLTEIENFYTHGTFDIRLEEVEPIDLK